MAYTSLHIYVSGYYCLPLASPLRHYEVDATASGKFMGPPLRVLFTFISENVCTCSSLTENPEPSAPLLDQQTPRPATTNLGNCPRIPALTWPLKVNRLRRETWRGVSLVQVAATTWCCMCVCVGALHDNNGKSSYL